MKHRFTLLACASVLAAGLTGANAAEQPAAKPAADKPKATLSAEDSKKAEQYLVPSPADIMGALDHSSQIDWKALSAQIEKSGSGDKTSFADDSQKALNLGLRVADAFVAVEAKDKEQFNRCSDAVVNLAAELSADSGLSTKRDEAKKLLEASEWVPLTNLLEGLRVSVLKNFETATEKDSATLANLGAWLRGLNLTTGVLSSHYNAEGAKVLRQAGLVAYLKDGVDKLGSPAKDGKIVATIKAKLPEIETLCTFDAYGTLTEDKVKRLHELSEELIQAIKK